MPITAEPLVSGMLNYVICSSAE